MKYFKFCYQEFCKIFVKFIIFPILVNFSATFPVDKCYQICFSVQNTLGLFANKNYNLLKLCVSRHSTTAESTSRTLK